jgi:hypothetical protein
LIRILINSSRKLNSNTQIAAEWAISELMPRVKDISVHLVIKPLPEGEFGYAFRENHRNYEICLNSKQSSKSMLETLFHEMVHVKQYFRGELKVSSQWVWKGKINRQRYENQPWEIEASSLEHVMYKKFKKFIKN